MGNSRMLAKMLTYHYHHCIIGPVGSELLLETAAALPVKLPAATHAAKPSGANQMQLDGPIIYDQIEAKVDGERGQEEVEEEKECSVIASVDHTVSRTLQPATAPAPAANAHHHRALVHSTKLTGGHRYGNYHFHFFLVLLLHLLLLVTWPHGKVDDLVAQTWSSSITSNFTATTSTAIAVAAAAPKTYPRTSAPAVNSSSSSLWQLSSVSLRLKVFDLCLSCGHRARVVSAHLAAADACSTKSPKKTAESLNAVHVCVLTTTGHWVWSHFRFILFLPLSVAPDRPQFLREKKWWVAFAQQSLQLTAAMMIGRITKKCENGTKKIWFTRLQIGAIKQMQTKISVCLCVCVQSLVCRLLCK